MANQNKIPLSQRMAVFQEAGLYLVTSEPLSAGRSTLTIIQEALAGGVKLIQLREKEMAPRRFVEMAVEARKLIHDAGAILIINDRLDVALASGADGVHLGQDDFPPEYARKIGPDLIIGVSTHNIEEAVLAEKYGASYVNIGPVFPTKTKAYEGEYIGLDGISRISSHISIPFTVMGGIKQENIPDLTAHGARTIAVVTAVTQADSPRVAAESLRRLILDTRK
ncbi:MAG: thiamine phosphate synthase [Lentisphaerae bacterium]|nr:thiamine phosphate synthase [Lentisphaerota bacterium]